MAVFKGLEKNCEVCGVVFRFPKSRKNPRSCSNECGYKLRGIANSLVKVELKCECCGVHFYEHQCHAQRRRFCSSQCQHKDEAFRLEKSTARIGDKNPAWQGGISIKYISRTGIKYSRSSKAKENAKAYRRRAAKLQATPSWADPILILTFYEEAQRMSIETGVVHHVDHMVPLQSRFVCGLHTHDNLCVMIGADNISKSNRSWPDMP